jgi:hypothetical protein
MMTDGFGFAEGKMSRLNETEKQKSSGRYKVTLHKIIA